MFGITSPTYPGLGQRRSNADRFALGLPTTAHLNSDKQLPGVGAQSGFDRFKDGLPNMTELELRNRVPGRNEGSDPTRAPEAEMMDTVTRLQLEVEALKFGPLGHSTLGGPTSLVRSKPMVFTSTKVPKFAGVTSWEKYRQVFDAIAQSNGWDDATVALQLMSHLEGDALNVALLVPEASHTDRTGWDTDGTLWVAGSNDIGDEDRSLSSESDRPVETESIDVSLRRRRGRKERISQFLP